MEKWKKSCNEYKSIGENDEGDKEKRLLKRKKENILGKRRMKRKKMTKNYAICTNK